MYTLVLLPKSFDKNNSGKKNICITLSLGTLFRNCFSFQFISQELFPTVTQFLIQGPELAMADPCCQIYMYSWDVSRARPCVVVHRDGDSGCTKFEPVRQFGRTDHNLDAQNRSIAVQLDLKILFQISRMSTVQKMFLFPIYFTRVISLSS